jgi:oxidase EvaA
MNSPTSVPDVPSPIQFWAQDIRRWSDLKVVETTVGELPTWNVADGVLQHVTGRYFSVTGVRSSAKLPELAGLRQPIILQPEVGILGYLLRVRAGQCELLVQAKVEPGNIGGVQLAPTVQATKSNYMRVHGGAPTPYLRLFTEPDPGSVVSDTLQSEQGTRFLGKYNRNVTVIVKDSADAEPINHIWKWCDASSLSACLNGDFTVNTDARSVLVCTPWGLLAPAGLPFERWRGTDSIGRHLLDSFCAGEDRSTLSEEDVLRRLETWRADSPFDVVTEPIETVYPALRLGRATRSPIARGVQIRAFLITVNGREVSAWDQPFLSASRDGRVVLICQRRNGIMHFMMRGRIEVGFTNRIQLGPSIQDEGSDQNADSLAEWFAHAHSIEHLACMQSDEGGRLYRQVSRYSIAEIEPGTETPEAQRIAWLTLKQIHSMLRIKGCFSNEARSALSMLLALL